MTAFGLTGTNDLPFASGDEDDDSLHEEKKSRQDWNWSEIGRIGTVEEGSLEEDIWRELGALPRSRRLNLHS
ncbi:MAG TPA: hypothetical protein VKA94_07950 [Hyphomicrobiales bacterium]|nr:hypothetical protein [Hyphomicrobiales bacterium]